MESGFMLLPVDFKKTHFAESEKCGLWNIYICFQSPAPPLCHNIMKHDKIAAEFNKKTS
jgi:hypothetical protein